MDNLNIKQSDDLWQLMYISTAHTEFSEAELDSLLDTCKHNNAKRGLSGMLFYRNKQFIQCLEGPLDSILQLYKIIKADPRHYGLFELYRKPIEQRDFDQWQMGYSRLSDEQLPGFYEQIEEFTAPVQLEEKANEALETMRLMYQSEIGVTE